MEISLKKAIIALSASVLASVSVQADISWFTRYVTAGDADYITDSNGTTRLPAGANATVGYFVQLIDAGINGVPDTATLTGNGAGGDDVVVDVAFLGQSSFTPEAGRLNSQSVTEPNPLAVPPERGQRYFVRAWNGISSSFTANNPASLIPGLSPGLRYGNGFVSGSPAGTLFVPTSLNDITNTETFRVGAFSTTLTAVPEAGTAGLAGLGMLVLRRFLRRKTA